MKKILVTGASGFIGSHLIKHLLDHHKAEFSIRGLIRESDKKNMTRLHGFTPQDGHIIAGDLTRDINGLCEGVDYVIHTAALTFVDRSILSPEPFVRNNVLGTLNLLEDAKRYKVQKFIHVSTDEVYGAIAHGAYTEHAMLNPRNPYAASKAGADCLTMAYAHTFGMNTLVTRTENNYGAFQHPQKAIPTFVKALLNDWPIPVYGDGLHSRMWLHVSDHVRALLHLLEWPTTPGDIYHIAGAQELTNRALAEKICLAFGKQPEEIKGCIEYIDDHNIRPGHDRRYALDTEKLRRIGWSPKVELDAGIKQTVDWYKNNEWWLK